MNGRLSITWENGKHWAECDDEATLRVLKTALQALGVVVTTSQWNDSIAQWQPITVKSDREELEGLRVSLARIAQAASVEVRPSAGARQRLLRPVRNGQARSRLE